jgi:heat shock protein HslJ
MRYGVLGLGALTVLFVVTGCAGGGEPATPGGGGPGTPVDPDVPRGASFTTGELTEGGTARPLAGGTTLGLRFTDDGRLVASAGCNTLSGPVTVEDGRLSVGELSMTEMGCAPDLHAQDQLLSGFLAGGPSWALDGERLVLTAGTTELVLTREAELPLVGTTWTADTLITGDVAGSTPAGVTLTLVFGTDSVAIGGLCNLRELPYRVAGSTLTFEARPMTMMACAPEIMTMEQAAVALFDGATTYRIDTHALTILRDGTGLRFTGGR